jgi:hypothetical protein
MLCAKIAADLSSPVEMPPEFATWTALPCPPPPPVAPTENHPFADPAWPPPPPILWAKMPGEHPSPQIGIDGG